MTTGAGQPRHAASDPFEHYDAAYVLGALTTADRRDFEAHMAGCPACTAAVGALAGLPGLLASVSPDVVESLAVDPEDPPASLLPRLIARANRRRRLTWVAIAGAAAAVVAVFVLVLMVTARPATTTQNAGLPVTLAVSGTGSGALSANAHLVSVAWGTRIDLKCTYEDVPGWDSNVYFMTITDRTGTTQSVASWTALPGKTASLTGSTATRVGDIAALDVRDTKGDVLLSWTP
jgi:hypothetical protein